MSPETTVQDHHALHHPDFGTKPDWLTFDCYGTLIQWDEGLLAAVARILDGKALPGVDPRKLIAIYDEHEHALEGERPHRSFRDVSGEALRRPCWIAAFHTTRAIARS